MSTETLIKKEEEPKVLILETLERRDSGYVNLDTKGTAHEERIDTASVRFVPNRGKMAKKDTNGRTIYVPIRYIKGSSEIEVSKQKELGITPNLPEADTIQIDKGVKIVKEEGDLALYNYLSNVFYNVDAPHRSKNAKAIFRVVQVDKKSESLNEKSFLRADAVNYVAGLVLRTGKDSFRYQEAKIDNILEVMNVLGGDSYSQKINALTRLAESDPAGFLQKVKTLENVVITEITHALELSVITFVGNNVEYVEDKKVVANLGDAKMKKDKQIEALSDLLRTPEYASAYQELKAKTEIAAEKNFKK